MVYTKIRLVYGVRITADEMLSAFSYIVDDILRQWDVESIEKGASDDPSFFTDLLISVRESILELYSENSEGQECPPAEDVPMNVFQFHCCSKSCDNEFIFGMIQKDDVTRDILNNGLSAAAMKPDQSMEKRLEQELLNFSLFQGKARESLVMFDDCAYCGELTRPPRPSDESNDQ